MVPTDRPFTLHSSGCSRAVLRRLELAGEVRRLVRGVYAHADLVLDAEMRHRAVDLAVPEDAVAVGVTAAWAHGLLDECPRLESAHRAPVGLLEATITTGRDLGLPVYDAALRQGLSHLELLEAVPPDQRSIAAVADARAASWAESRLREAWLAADLPTPFVGHQVVLPGGPVRLALAHPARAYAADCGDWPAGAAEQLSAAGWWVTRIEPRRLDETSAGALGGHLRREFHRQLLAQVEVSSAG